MGTNANKHARQRERRNRLDEARREMEKKARLRRMLTVVGVLIAVAVIAGAVVLLTRDGNETADDSTPDTTAATGSELPEPPPGIELTEETPCPPPTGSDERVQRFAGPPPMCIDPAASYTATFSTTMGDFTAELATDAAPNTVNNFVVLSRYGYYDGVPFHRVVPGFVIQAGDGDGAPYGNNDLGYTLEDELPADSSAYTDYSLAMANSGPDTNGSQFFVVLPGGGQQLQPSYSYFGQVTQGQDVVDAIGSLGGGPSEEPTEEVLINTLTISETPPEG